MAGGRIEIDVEPNTSDFPDQLESGLEGATSTASKIGAALGLALGAGTIATGVKKSIEIGIDFDSVLNQIRGTSGATAAEMQQVSTTARALGNDLTLPGTSATDSAAAMLELSKGGFTVVQSMQAAKGSLALAAAAQIDAASAATIQSDAINTFNLKATDASHVADVLANAANSSSAEITDISQGLAQGGAVARQFGLSIEDTATSLAVLASNGIKGSDAGTLLKSTLLAMTRDTEPVNAAIEQLGLTTYDAQGRFVGMESMFGQLQEASKKMTPQMYQAATATLFGSDAARLSGVAAGVGADGYNKFRDAINQQGTAAKLAADYNAGVPGAMEAIQNAVEGAGLAFYDLIRGPLNTFTRSAAQGITDASGRITGAVRGIFAAFSSGDPRLGFLTNGLDDLRTAGGNLVDGLSPVGAAILNAGRSAGESGGLVDTATGAVSGLTSTVAALSSALGPLGSLLGGVVGAVTSIPTPILAAAAAYGVLRLAQGRYSNALQNNRASTNAAGTALNVHGREVNENARRLGVFSRATYGATRGMSQLSTEYRTQQRLGTLWGRQMGTAATLASTYRTSTLGAVAASRSMTDQYSAIRAGAAAAGQPIGRLNAAFQTMGERSGAIGRMGTAYQGAAASTSAFARTQGVAAAGMSGLRSAGAGVAGLFGGPLGLALAGAAVAGGAWASSAARQKSVTDAYRQSLSELGEEQKSTNQLLLQTRGAAAEPIFASLTKQVDLYKSSVDSAAKADAKWTDVAKSWFNLGDWGKNLSGDTDNDSVSKMDRAAADAQKAKAALDDLGMTSDELGRKIGGGAEEWSTFHDQLARSGEGGAIAAAKLQGLRDTYVQAQEAARRTSPGFTELQAAVQKFSDSTATAADKSNALKAALDALNPARGKQATLAAFNEQARTVAESLGEATDQAQGFGKELLNADGSINSSTANGGALSSTLMNLVDSYNSAASAGNNMDELAAKNNKTIGDLAAKYGVSADEIRRAANTLGLSDVDLVVKLSGYGEVTQGLGIVNRQLDSLKPGQPRVIEVQAGQVTNTTRDVLTKLGFELRDVEQNGVKTVRIEARTDDAQARLRDIIGLVQGTPAGKSISVNAPGGQAVKDLLISMGALVTTDNDKNIVVSSPLAPGVLQLLKDLGIQVTTNNDKTILTRAETAGARTALDNLLKPETKTITVQTIESAQAQIANNGTGIPYRQDVIDAARGARATGGPVSGFATGGGVLAGLVGAVRGPGTGTSDSIPAQVQEGSHVFTAAETRAAGGPDAVMRLLGSGRRGAASATRRLVGVRLSNGETVADPGQVEAAGGHNAVLGLRRALAGPGFNLGGMVNAEKVGKDNDGLPYITGARDCSMWVSWMVQAAKGEALQRLFTTYTLLGGQTGGLVPGASRTDLLAVGTSQEHMAATVMTDKGPVDTETGGGSSPSQVRWGRGAAGAFDPQFTQLYHLPVSLVRPAPTADNPDAAKTDPAATTDSTSATTPADTTASSSSSTAAPTIEAPKPPKLEDVGAEAAKIGIRGLLDTLGLGDSILADPGQSTIGQAAQIGINTERFRREQSQAPADKDDDSTSGKPKKKKDAPDPTDPTGMRRLMEYGRFTDDFEDTYGVTRDSAVVIALLKYRSEKNRKKSKTTDVGALNGTTDRDGIKALMDGGQFTDRFGSSFGQTADSKLTAALLAERARLGPAGVRRFADGGISPMAAGLAAVVPPNALRVVGDRQKNDEFFIPDTDEPQHVAMGAEWARRRGFQLVSMYADGGIASRAAQTQPGVPVTAGGGGDHIEHKNYTYSGPPEYADAYFASARRSDRIDAQAGLRQRSRKGTNIR